MTSGELDLTHEVTKGLKYFEVLQIQSMPSHWLNLTRLLCRGKPAMIVKNLTSDLTCNVTSDPQINFSTYSSSSCPGLSNRETRIRPVVWQRAGGNAPSPLMAGRDREYLLWTPPPPTTGNISSGVAGRVREYSSGVRVKNIKLTSGAAR